jgi:thioredoxin-related protein
MLNKNIVTLICLISLITSSFSQVEKDGLVKWLSFKEAQEKNKTLQKPFIVDIYTDWCGWCKHMMKTTYSNPAIADYINNNFYAVKFDAETKDTIEYNGKIYKPLSPDPKTPHELAIKFLSSSLSYPSTMFITNNFEYNLLTQGYLDEKKIEPILIFMVENAWRTSVFDEFNKHFSHTFTDTNFVKGKISTYSFSELEKLQKKKPKKVIVNIGANFCNTCRVISKTTFVDTSIANYVNKNFYLVNFNAESNDTIVFKNTKYYKQLVNNYPLHNLAITLTNNKFSLPAICLLGEQLNSIDVLNFYQSPEQIKPILIYIGSNAYKTKNFNDFMEVYRKPVDANKAKK